jgi:hypothetical protein
MLPGGSIISLLDDQLCIVIAAALPSEKRDLYFAAFRHHAWRCAVASTSTIATSGGRKIDVARFDSATGVIAQKLAVAPTLFGRLLPEVLPIHASVFGFN